MALDPFSSLDDEWRTAVEAAHQDAWDALPELTAQWGERGRFHARQDMAFHAIFLRSALEAAPQAFKDYVLWALRVLEARNVPAAALEVALNAFAKRAPAGGDLLREAADAVAGAAPPATPAPNALTDALLSGEAGRVRELLGPVADRIGHQAAATRLMEAMVEVGERWSLNQISVAEEHLATATCQRVLAGLRDVLPRSRSQGKLLLACVEGNLHDLGLRATADQCAAAGYDARFLGADVPTRDLASLCQAEEPDAVLLSAALSTHVRSAKAAVEALRAATDAKIYVGGQAFAGGGDMWRLSGADGQAVLAPDLLAT